jgi:hypothetical protein
VKLPLYIAPEKVKRCPDILATSQSLRIAHVGQSAKTVKCGTLAIFLHPFLWILVLCSAFAFHLLPDSPSARVVPELADVLLLGRACHFGLLPEKSLTISGNIFHPSWFAWSLSAIEALWSASTAIDAVLFLREISISELPLAKRQTIDPHNEFRS